jgi:hypothetical protein
VETTIGRFTFGSVEYTVLHDPKGTVGYQWMAETADQGYPPVYGSTMREVKRQLTELAKVK